MRRRLAANCHLIKRQTASTYQHTASMSTPRQSSAALAANLKTLMESKGLSQAELARVSGVAQRTISTLLDVTDPTASNPRSRTIDQLAAYFGLPGWMLQIHDLPIEVLLAKRLPKLVKAYSRATPEVRAGLESSSTDGASQAPADVDQQLLARSLEVAMTSFRAARQLPDDRQLAAAAAYVYAHVSTGQKMKDAEKTVRALLDRADSEGLISSSPEETGR